MKIILILVLASSIFFGCTERKVRADKQEILPVSMDVGISIGTQEFRGLVEKYMGLMEAAAEMTIEDYIIMVRLWNTIDVYRLAPTDELYQRYSAAFFPAFVEPISKALNTLPTKGMALYSKEYDIYIGGYPDAGSQYQLEKGH